jgi:hypothetical protein
VGINGSGYHYGFHSDRGGCTTLFFVTWLKSFLSAIHTSADANTAIFFLDNVHERRKSLPTVFGGEGACVDRMVGCVVMELSEFSHGSLLSNYAEFLEPGFETVGLGKGSTNNFGVRIMKHCHTHDVHVRIWVDRGWVIIVMACANHDMHGAILICPVERQGVGSETGVE